VILDAREIHRYHVGHTDRTGDKDDIRNEAARALSTDNFVDGTDGHSAHKDDMSHPRDEIKFRA
jgi:hypothetical protein